MNFGELTDEKSSFSIMDEALDAGINFFDTADVYRGPQERSDGTKRIKATCGRAGRSVRRPRRSYA